MANTEENQEIQQNNDNCEFMESSFNTLTVLSVTTIFTSIIGICGYLLIWPEFKGDWPRMLFIIYLFFYLSFWIVYFLSKSGPKFFRVGTLRRLLLAKSKHWTDSDTTENDEIENISMEKAKTSVTAIAMLVAVSFLGMVQAKGFYLDLISLVQGERYEHSTWYLTILGFALLSSLIAFISFVISADALDCMFNEFEGAEMDNRLRRYFYRSTIHPRYFGLVFLMTSIIFLVSYINPILGSIVIGLIITIGYRHWFPPASIIEDNWDGVVNNSGFWLRLVMFVVPPIFLMLCT